MTWGEQLAIPPYADEHGIHRPNSRWPFYQSDPQNPTRVAERGIMDLPPRDINTDAVLVHRAFGDIISPPESPICYYVMQFPGVGNIVRLAVQNVRRLGELKLLASFPRITVFEPELILSATFAEIFEWLAWYRGEQPPGGSHRGYQ